ncbi:hypothetical protein CALVIDRAFT_536699 [Calocera viscosa TUFC12733]|uniref:Uncharacterized protein n=1 Tax=Calocera viscosa (strain TUFC12733) TaxID=1330018 RepID=A0A167MJA5_CALVF|nr:hypothetical protein CALVIDRAFT_536699 [Calocera viscosa TUFC12733]
MAASQPAKQRVALLSHAIDLCTNLRDTLERVGPSRWTRSADFLSADEYATVLKVHELESTLQRHLQEVNEKRNDALAPVSRLPDDVLRIIFLHMVDIHRDDYRSYVHYVFVKDLSSVSRRWRAIALDTANLWTGVSFAEPKYLADADSNPIHPWYGSAKVLSRTVVCNLERSKLALLRVGMNVPAEASVPAMVREYMRTCSGRVGELTVTVQGQDARLLDAIVPCVAQTAGVLRRFRFRVEDAINGVDGRGAVEQFLALNLPSLVEIRLRSVPLPLKHRQEYTALLGCRQLHFTIKHPLQFHFPQLVALLRCTPALEELHVDLMVYQDTAPLELEERLVLPELRNLDISCSIYNLPRLPLVILSAPKLNRLALDSHGDGDNEEQRDRNASDVVGFLEASVGLEGRPPPVRTLIAMHGGTISGLNRILPALAGLEVLRVVFGGEIAEQEVELTALLDKLGPPIHSVELGVPPSTSYLGPRLRTLECLADTTPSNVRQLIRLASRRKAAGIPLTRVRMGPWPGSWLSDRSQMPETPEEQYALERALASEVDILECDQYRWDWGEEPQGPGGMRGGWSKVD